MGSTNGKFWYDDQAAEAAVRWFPRYLVHVEGPLTGKPLVLADWQADRIIRPLYGWKRDHDHSPSDKCLPSRCRYGRRRYRRLYQEVPRGNGKALSLDTRIPTPTGWTTMGDIGVGDMVFDDRGIPCSVTATSEVMIGRPCYRVRFSDGTSVVADAGHQWYTNARRSGRPSPRGMKGIPMREWPQKFSDHIRTTAQIAATLTVGHRTQVERNHSIPLAGAIVLPERDLPIPPYTFGVWLGDGTSANSNITTADDEVLAGIAGDGFAYKVAVLAGKATTYRVGSGAAGGSVESRAWTLHAKLRSLGVQNNKHIPRMYLRGSFTQRLALFTGLMDTDGSIAKNGQCEFTTTSPALADGVLELSRSLGLKVTRYTGRAMLNGRDCGPKWRLQFWAFADLPIFTIRRKVERQKQMGARKSSTGSVFIVGADPVASVPVRCITVDSPTHLFLAGEGFTPTHNSTSASGLALKGLVGDGEPSPQVIGAATDRNTANIIFGYAARNVRHNPLLSQRLRVLDATKRILGKQGDRIYHVLSADAPRAHGYHPTRIVFDELHAQPNRELYDVLSTSQVTLDNPLLAMFTTAGFDRKSICGEMHEHALRVLNDETYDEEFLPVVYAADPGDDITDERIWEKANPNLGISVDRASIRMKVQEGLASPSYLNTVLRLHFNIWTTQDSRWMPMDEWDRCGGIVVPSELKGRRCYGGLDLASTTDLTAFSLVFPPDDEETGTYQVLTWYWVPEEGIRKRSSIDHVPYEQWAQDSYIKATPGTAVDLRIVKADIITLSKQYNIREIAFDRWGATQISNELNEEGLMVVPFGQGYRDLTEPTKKLLEYVLGHRINHGGNPVLRWNADNLVVTQDPAGNQKPDKAKSTERIDGAVALIMALGRAVANKQQGVGPSIRWIA